MLLEQLVDQRCGLADILAFQLCAGDLKTVCVAAKAVVQQHFAFQPVAKHLRRRGLACAGRTGEQQHLAMATGFQPGNAAATIHLHGIHHAAQLGLDILAAAEIVAGLLLALLGRGVVLYAQKVHDLFLRQFTGGLHTAGAAAQGQQAG